MEKMVFIERAESGDSTEPDRTGTSAVDFTGPAAVGASSRPFAEAPQEGTPDGVGGVPALAGDEERVEQAVRSINKKVQATVHFGMLQIGYYLLQTFFDGRIEEALSRNPHKHHSFRKLCRRPDLLISSTHLVSAVKLVVQERQLASEPAFQTLPVSHKIALLGVRDEARKRELARRVRPEGLSVRALTREVRAMRGASVSEADAWARRLKRALDVVIDSTSHPAPDGVSTREALALDRAICEARKRLQTTLGGLRGIRSVAV